MLPSGLIATWDGKSQGIQVSDPGGTVRELIPLPGGTFFVTEHDREAWFRTRIPESFGFQGDICRAVRAKARREVVFPSHHPPALQLRADPVLGVWVQRRPESSGAVWMWLDGEGVRAELRLLPRHRLLAVGHTLLVVGRPLGDGSTLLEVYPSVV